jgi:hypothetical protein
MDSVKQSVYILTGVGIVGFILLFATAGLDDMFDLTSDVAYGSPLIATIVATFCLVIGVLGLVGVLPDRWFTE